jgi:hypothetical protein
MADEKQEAQKTIVAFVVGLLIGGLLVWAFSGPTDKKMSKESETPTKAEEVKVEVSADETTTEATPTLSVGEGKIVVNNQAAGDSVAIASAVYPVAEGWIGVRDYSDEKLGLILGVVRVSESQGLVPKDIVLQRATKAGGNYAIVVYTENGDRSFNLADDVQVDTVFATFTAE